jgi:hypothetical protein
MKPGLALLSRHRGRNEDIDCTFMNVLTFAADAPRLPERDNRCIRVFKTDGAFASVLSELAKGLMYYRDAESNEPVPEPMNVGGCHISDVKISSAFDVSSNKVGRDVAEAVLANAHETGIHVPQINQQVPA